MEYLVFAAAIAVFLIFVFVQGKLSERKVLEYFRNKLCQMKGKLPEKEYKVERFFRIPGYYEKHKKEFQIDDITWNDLNMDDIFMRMNYTMSSTGEEYLYYMLRTPLFDTDDLQHFHEVVSFYEQNDEDRIKYQSLMNKLGSTGKYSIYDYLEYLNNLGQRSNKKDILMLGVFLLVLAVSFFDLGIGIIAILVWMFSQMFRYFKIKKENEPYLTSLSYIMRLIDISQKVMKVLPEVCENEVIEIEKSAKVLQKSQKGAYWVFGSIYKTGSPLDAVLDYVRMVFHVDLIFFNKMLDEIIKHLQDVDQLITCMGWVESAVSVSLYRASLSNGWCLPQLGKEELKTENAYHPMISVPVKNSIQTQKSVLLTGSNASGKSTFLKTMALNALLAQTIYTVTADSYEAPYYYLYSSMSLRDDIESGDSYYIVEIKSIKRIIDSKKSKDKKILCVVDEVLRGTNTVERIAASTQILLSMAGENIQCFAATHDIELTQLLEKVYENYHFEEEIKDGDVLFNYKLQKGKATTRNAIKLLEIMGYDSKIVDMAKTQANHFLSQGVWKLP